MSIIIVIVVVVITTITSHQTNNHHTRRFAFLRFVSCQSYTTIEAAMRPHTHLPSLQVGFICHTFAVCDGASDSHSWHCLYHQIPLEVTQMQQEHDKRQLSLIAEHNEQLKRTQLQAENELREKTMFMRNDHEAQIKALRCELEDECRKLEEELHLQKSKEDRQRALLQLQWKVMSDKPKEDQEVNSKQDYSISSIKRRSSCGVKRNLQHDVDSPYFEATQTPVPKLLKKVDNIKTGSAVSIPKRHRKVTRHEYEVETSNGRTITKKRKTRSTVMFEDPRNRKINTPKVNTPGSVVKSIKGGGHTNPSNIGDLFSEGSLNPYADDPYAFD